MKDINESFISLENKGSIKSDLSEIRLLSFNKTAKYSPLGTGKYSPLETANIIVTERPQPCRILAEHASNPWWSVDLSGNYKIKNVQITNPIVMDRENPSQTLPIINVFVTAKEYSSAAEIPVENRCGEAISMPKPPQPESVENDIVLDVQCENQIGRYVYIFLNSTNVTYGMCRVRVYGDDVDQKQNINTLSSFAIRNTHFFFSFPILSTFLFSFTL